MNILFCVDGSEESKKALRLSAPFLKKRDFKITLFNVLPEIRESYKHYENFIDEEIKEVRKVFKKGEEDHETEAINESVEILKEFGIRAKKRHRHGEAVDEILNEIEEGDYELVILGSHGYTGLKKVLMGSVSSKIMEKSPISVLIVKSRRED